MPSEKSAIGGEKRTTLNQPARSIFTDPAVSNASDAVVMIRGTDGKPQLFATGDQRWAQSFVQECVQTLGLQHA